MKIYKEKDISTDYLKDKTIGVIGYGIQGRAQALNWHDSGYDVVVGLRENSNSFQQVKRDGLRALSIEETANSADVICMLCPDMAMKETYDRYIHNQIKGKVLYFSHGFSITFNRIVPPKECDVVMVAPKGPGKKVRELYEKGFGVPALISVHQDYSGKAKDYALELAHGLGCARAGIIECSFDQETITDLFGEQAVLCGGVVELVKNGFETLVERGYPPEMAYFEVLHELKLIVDLIQEGGISYMWNRVSETARYGGLTRGKRIISREVKKRMHEILDEIEDGSFAHEWINEYNANLPRFSMLLKKESKHQIEAVGKEIRSLFFDSKS